MSESEKQTPAHRAFIARLEPARQAFTAEDVAAGELEGGLLRRGVLLGAAGVGEVFHADVAGSFLVGEVVQLNIWEVLDEFAALVRELRGVGLVGHFVFFSFLFCLLDVFFLA